MAAEVQVSKRTMDAAKKVVKLGLTDEVIKHRKSVEQVLKGVEFDKVIFDLNVLLLSLLAEIYQTPKLLEENREQDLQKIFFHAIQ